MSIVAVAAAVLALASPNGAWTGSYSGPLSSVPVRMVVEMSGRSALVVLPAGHTRARVGVRTAGARLRFSVPGRPPLAFDGRLSGARISGTYRQGSARGRFTLVRREPPAVVGLPRWLGTYALSGGRTLIVSQFGPQAYALVVPDGTFRALYALGGRRFAIGAALGVREPNAGVVEFARDASSAVWNGERASRATFRQEEVRFTSGSASLAGTLTLPVGPGPHPAVTFAHGSGSTSRSFLQNWVSFFASHGIATLAVDKRGVGESGGRWPGEAATEESIDAYARDVEAAVRFLAAQPEIDRARIGLSGGSQAGWIIPRAAVREPLVSFAVVLVGPLISVGENGAYADLTHQGGSPPTATPEEMERAMDAQRSGVDSAPWVRRMRIPGLWLYGGLDQHVATARSVRVLGQIKAETGGDFTWVVFPTGQHGLVEVKTGLQAEVPLATRLVPGLFETVRDWLRSRGITSAS